MKQNKQFRFLFILFFPFLFLLSCGGKDKHENLFLAGVANFIETTDEVVGYGYLNLERCIEKAEVDQLPDIMGFLNSILASIGKGIDVKEKLYIVAQGPINSHAGVESTYAFAKVNKKRDLERLVNEAGLHFEEIEGVNFYQNESIAIGYNDQYIVVINKRKASGLREEMKRAFVNLETRYEIERDFVLKEENHDFVFALDLKTFYQSNELIKTAKYADLAAAFEEGELLYYVDFEKGKVVNTLDLKKTNEAFKQLLPFGHNNSHFKAVRTTVDEDIALNLSLNMEKVDKLIAAYWPNTNASFFRSFGPVGLLLEGIAGDKLSNLMNGTISYTLFNSVASVAMGVFELPNSQLSFEFGKEKQNILELLESLKESNLIVPIDEDIYRYEDIYLKYNDDAIVLQFNEGDIELLKQNQVQKRAVDHPLSFQWNMAKLTKDYLTEPLFGTDLAPIESIRLIGDKDKFSLTIEMKDKEKNSLHELGKILLLIEEDGFITR